MSVDNRIAKIKHKGHEEDTKITNAGVGTFFWVSGELTVLNYQAFDVNDWIVIETNVETQCLRLE